MNAYESNINERIANIKSMLQQAEELKTQRNELDYPANKELVWNLMDKETQIEGNIKRSIRSLAKTLGFTIKEQEFMNWGMIFNCIEHRWNVSQIILHSLDSVCTEYIKNA